MKRFLSVILAAGIIFTASVNFFAGYAVTAPESFVTVQQGEKSEYGYVGYKFIDDFGDEINASNPRDFIPDSSQAMTFTVIPSSYDSREYGYVTSPEEQGDSGNCWVFSSVSALENDCLVNGTHSIETADFSEAHLSWFASRSLVNNPDDLASGDGRTSTSPYLTGGNWQTATAALSRWSGLANESDFPFYPDNLDAMGNYPEEQRYNREGGAVINSAEYLLDINDVKQWIINHGSTTAAFGYFNEYYNADTASYYNNGSADVNHQITIVGWDDSYSSENFNTKPEGDGAWLCQNSWGDSWGNGGYFRISYYDISLCDFVSFSAKPVDENDKNYTYNGAGYVGFFEYARRVKMANVFTAGECEKLKAISIYTVSPATDITVKVYTNLRNNYKDPTYGKLALSFDTFVARAGYHTIDLEKEIMLPAGTVFSVIVESIDANGKGYIPIEANIGTGDTYSANAGESYYDLGVEYWWDSTAQGYKNVCIQAFTETGHHSLVTEGHFTSCIEGGTEKAYCTDCGYVAYEKASEPGEHTFGEWSEYRETSPKKMVSESVCSVCGAIQQKSYIEGNVVSLRELIEMIFECLFSFFKKL